jgi:hypothetical protein
VTVARQGNGRGFDAGTRVILEELRDLRVETRADRRQAEAERRADLRLSEERFREDAARRDALLQTAFKDIHTVGLAIVRTLDDHSRILRHHSRILESMDRKLGARRKGGPGNGRRA